MKRGVLRWAAELSGVDAKTIETLALTYARTKPACLYSGWTAGALSAPATACTTRGFSWRSRP